MITFSVLFVYYYNYFYRAEAHVMQWEKRKDGTGILHPNITKRKVTQVLAVVLEKEEPMNLKALVPGALKDELKKVYLVYV